MLLKFTDHFDITREVVCDHIAFSSRLALLYCVHTAKCEESRQEREEGIAPVLHRHLGDVILRLSKSTVINDMWPDSTLDM
jgi:hypothetical protein